MFRWNYLYRYYYGFNQKDKKTSNFTNLDEAVEQVMYAIKNPDDAERVAMAALKAVKPHTWDARVKTILETVGLV